MRKPTFYVCQNKDADQLCGHREADQRLCFRYIDSTIPLLSKSEIFKPLAMFCSCTALFVLDLVGNQNVGFLMTRLKSFSLGEGSQVGYSIKPSIVFDILKEQQSLGFSEVVLLHQVVKRRGRPNDLSFIY